MPNWCNNSVEISHEDPAMVEKARKAFNEGALLNAFIPVPEDLKIVAGCVGSDTDPEQIALVESENHNLAKHGYKNWYDFCVGEWGTKWDIGADGYEAQDLGKQFGHGLILSFESAWSPPIAAYEKLTEMGFSIRAYYDEPGMAFCGKWEDGDDDFYEYGGYNSETVRDLIGEELDDMFGISESMAQYEDQQED